MISEITTEEPLYLWNDHPLDADLVSVNFDKRIWSSVSCMLEWYGTPVGSVSVEVHNQPRTQELQWAALPESTFSVNGPGGRPFDFSKLGFRFFRLRYTRVSGSGTIIACISAGRL